jgi:hypothetical protein
MARMNLLGALTLAIVFTRAGAGAVLALEPGHDHDDHAHLDTSKGLLVTSRSTLKVCVETGSSAQPQPAIRASLRLALGMAKQHPSWRKAYGGDDGTVDFGCPQPRLPERFDRRTTVAGPGVTDDPSAYRVWLYLLDPATADRVLGTGLSKGLAAAELMREATVLFPVSTALLVRDTGLNDISALAGDLLVALGLEQDHDPSEEAQ